VTDDLHPHYLLKKGDMNCVVDLAIEQGLDPVFSEANRSLYLDKGVGL